MANRSLKLEIYLSAEQADLLQPVRDSIRRYRAACRQMYALLFAAEAAGAVIEQDDKGVRLSPRTNNARIALAAALGTNRVEKGEKEKGKGQSFTVWCGAASAYDMRNWFFEQLYPAAKSFVWDSARRDVTTAWSAKDPKLPKANRRWLSLQGARGVAKFERRAIGCPVATAKPQLTGHELVVEWDRTIGEVRFQIPRLDFGRYRVWQRLRDGEPNWELGTVFIGEHDGRLTATITYSVPDSEVAPDPTVIAVLAVSGEQITMTCGESVKSIPTIAARAFLAQHSRRREQLEARRAACGNPRRPWGHRRGWNAAQDVLSRLTEQRSRVVTDYSHAWSRRIVDWSVKWQAGRIQFEVPAGDVLGESWPWGEFVDKLTYKAAERGITIVSGPPSDPSQPTSAGKSLPAERP